MAFSIEVLQCKSKLNNLRTRKFMKKTFYPEMMPRENEPVLLKTTHNLMNAVLSAITKVRQAMGQSVDAQRINEADIVDFESVVASEDTNSDGFIEVNFTKETDERSEETEENEKNC
ncbi:hypothetical protein TSAR_011459 [Trichomalopsis sarcophagae]|uniref:Uncharacterized protein n=1 Tax=Trichomalopsis sarcophagae TaxID=543379 RepID=A0A232FCV5_9HYME|nr:hypothetical protein TSAR_011459 [Trichomalopsis sarcophagae]